MKIDITNKNTWNRILAIWSIFGAVIGALVTYFRYRQK